MEKKKTVKDKIKKLNPVKKSLVLDDSALRKIYIKVYYPDYPPSSLHTLGISSNLMGKVKQKDNAQVFIESDRIAVRQQAKVFVEWIKKRVVEAEGAFTVNLSVKEIEELNGILEL